MIIERASNAGLIIAVLGAGIDIGIAAGHRRLPRVLFTGILREEREKENGIQWIMRTQSVYSIGS